jgi:putative RNA 2'-phosphotransferase
VDAQRLVKVSKYLSKHLRHQPARLGITLDDAGWVDVGDLLAACARNHFPVTRAELNEVVKKNDKQRFAFDPTGTRIRANQGHSVPVDLQLAPAPPPAVLYHGTSRDSVPSIRENGLNKGGRHHVHLSLSVETAVKVGSRHGVPVVLAIDAAAMHRDGHRFYQSANGVWLVDHVPARYLRLCDEE